MKWLAKRRRPFCPNCLYIGDPNCCSCQWTIDQVVAGKGLDPEVIRNARNIQGQRRDQRGGTVI